MTDNRTNLDNIKDAISKKREAIQTLQWISETGLGKCRKGDIQIWLNPSVPDHIEIGEWFNGEYKFKIRLSMDDAKSLYEWLGELFGPAKVY